MALFKILKGQGGSNNENINAQPFHEGYCYITTDTNRFFIDVINDEGNEERIELTVDKADQLTNSQLVTLAGEVQGQAFFDGASPLTIETQLAYPLPVPNAETAGQVIKVKEDGSGFELGEGGSGGGTNFTYTETENDAGGITVEITTYSLISNDTGITAEI